MRNRQIVFETKELDLSWLNLWKFYLQKLEIAELTIMKFKTNSTDQKNQITISCWELSLKFIFSDLFNVFLDFFSNFVAFPQKPQLLKCEVIQHWSSERSSYYDGRTVATKTNNPCGTIKPTLFFCRTAVLNYDSKQMSNSHEISIDPICKLQRTKEYTLH